MSEDILENTIILLERRINQIYDTIQKNPNNMELDHMFLKYVEQLSDLLDQYEAL